MPELAHHSFAEVARRGPTVLDRVTGTAALRRWQLVGRAIGGALARTEVTGADRMPSTGPVILAVNHTTFLDGPLLFGLIRRPVSFLVKAEAFQPLNGLTGRILRSGAQLPVRRFQTDPGPVRFALQLLAEGGVLGMFPEGSRGDGLVRQVRPGVGYLAVRSGAPVIPVAVVGAPQMTRQWSRAPVGIVIGPQLRFPRAFPPVNRAVWTAAADAIQVPLASLVRDAMSNLVEPATRMEG